MIFAALACFAWAAATAAIGYTQATTTIERCVWAAIVAIATLSAVSVTRDAWRRP